MDGDCNRCHLHPATHRVCWHSTDLDYPVCCGCMDELMAQLALQVPAEEGLVGLARFRIDHRRDCGYVA